MAAMKNGKSNLIQYNDDFSLNQCSFLVRVDGDALEIPLNFGMTADEIRRLYPFMLQFANTPLENPSARFATEDRKGTYAALSEAEKNKLLEQTNEQARYWYGRSETSLLELGLRFAFDMKLRGIQELMDIFMPDTVLDNIQRKDIIPITDEEADRINEDLGLETATDKEHDPGDEQDIALGIAGDVGVNMYASDYSDEYFSDQLDEIESHLKVTDKFSEMLAKDVADAEMSGRYATDTHTLAEKVLGPDTKPVTSERKDVLPEKSPDSGMISMYDEDFTQANDAFLDVDDDMLFPEAESNDTLTKLSSGEEE